MTQGEIIQLVTGLGTSGIVFGVVFYIFSNLEKMLKEDSKKKLGRSLVRLINKPVIKDFAPDVYNLVNKLFTEKQFSVACFGRSFLASFLCVMFLHLGYFFFNAELFKGFPATGWVPFVSSFLFLFVLFSVIDYLLLWKTRRVLYVISNRSSNAWMIMLVDLAGTFLFGLVKYVLIMLLFTQTVDFGYFADIILRNEYPGKNATPQPVPGLFFYSTFFYSVFLWLYFMTIYLIRGVHGIKILNRVFQQNFDIENKPLEFIRIVFGILLMAAGFAAYGVRAIIMD